MKQVFLVKAVMQLYIADTFLDLSTTMIGYFLPIDKDKLKDDLINNHMVEKELSDIAASVS